jgi:hypothetical protein
MSAAVANYDAYGEVLEHRRQDAEVIEQEGAHVESMSVTLWIDGPVRKRTPEYLAIQEPCNRAEWT